MKKKPALPPKTGHGGKRKPGPGKKLGRPRGKGRVVVSASIAMHPDAWKKFDALRGTTARGVFITEKLGLLPR